MWLQQPSRAFCVSNAVVVAVVILFLSSLVVYLLCYVRNEQFFASSVRMMNRNGWPANNRKLFQFPGKKIVHEMRWKRTRHMEQIHFESLHKKQHEKRWTHAQPTPGITSIKKNSFKWWFNYSICLTMMWWKVFFQILFTNKSNWVYRGIVRWFDCIFWTIIEIGFSLKDEHDHFTFYHFSYIIMVADRRQEMNISYSLSLGFCACVALSRRIYEINDWFSFWIFLIIDSVKALKWCICGHHSILNLNQLKIYFWNGNSI